MQHPKPTAPERPPEKAAPPEPAKEPSAELKPQSLKQIPDSAEKQESAVLGKRTRPPTGMPPKHSDLVDLLFLDKKEKRPLNTEEGVPEAKPHLPQLSLEQRRLALQKVHQPAKTQRNCRWTRSEHIRFLQALILYGRDWRSVQKYVRTRSSTQSRSHAQKFLAKIKRKGFSLKEFLDNIDFDNLEKLSACDIGYDEELDLVLKAENDPANESGEAELSELDNQPQPAPEHKSSEQNSSQKLRTKKQLASLTRQKEDLAQFQRINSCGVMKILKQTNRYQSQRSPSRQSHPHPALHKTPDAYPQPKVVSSLNDAHHHMQLQLMLEQQQRHHQQAQEDKQVKLQQLQQLQQQQAGLVEGDQQKHLLLAQQYQQAMLQLQHQSTSLEQMQWLRLLQQQAATLTPEHHALLHQQQQQY